MITNYAANEIIKGMTGKVNSVSTLAPSAFVGLSSTEPDATGTNVTEPTGTSYKRVLIGNYNQSLTQLMSTPAEGKSSNTEIIYFPEALESWGTLPYFCLFSGDGASAKLLAWGSLQTPISPVANSVPLVRVGELVISLE